MTPLDRDAFERAVMTGEGIDDATLAIAAVAVEGLEGIHRVRAVAFMLAAERNGAFASIEAGIAGVMRDGNGDRDTLARMLAGIRAAREAL